MTDLQLDDIQPGFLIAPRSPDGEHLAPWRALGDDRTVSWDMPDASWTVQEVEVQDLGGGRTVFPVTVPKQSLWPVFRTEKLTVSFARPTSSRPDIQKLY